MSSKFNSSIWHYVNPKQKIFYSTSRKFQNHYEVLNLSRNCTAKDIKESFISLSKKHHPDLSKNKLAHSKFLQINEAYKVLSKAESRRNYDLGLSHKNCEPNARNSNVYQESYGPNPWNDPVFYHNRDASQDKFQQDKPYYGIKGLKKVPNSVVALVCLFVAACAVSLQVLLIRSSFTFNRNVLLEKSAEANKTLNIVKQDALTNGNELQVEILKLKLAQSKK